jgi:polyisoprenoid-binding protein YceI
MLRIRARVPWTAWLAVLTAPTALVSQAAGSDSAVYMLAAASRLEVRTGSAGLFGFAGHQHVIRARGFSGRLVYRPADPAESQVTIVVPVDSLEVLTPPDTAEIRKVTANMRHDVLDSGRFPEIRFESTGIVPRPEGFDIQANLTMHGVTQVVTVPVRITIQADTLAASGTFTVKQSDFGIRPYRVGPAGVVKVADRIEFQIDAIAVRVSSGR